jgi:hypothetical protein
MGVLVILEEIVRSITASRVESMVSCRAEIEHLDCSLGGIRCKSSGIAKLFWNNGLLHQTYFML